MQQSANYALKLPEGTDNVKRQDFVDNFITIDTQLKTLSTNKAQLDSPALTGSPTVPTPNVGDNSTKIANTAFVTTSVANKTSVSGNAGTATKLQTARTISLTGDVTGSTSFDGSGNASITATVADDSHNHVIANIDGLQSDLDNINTSLSEKANIANPTFTGAVKTANNTLDDGSGGVQVGGALNTIGVMEHGTKTIASTPYIDFHSSGNNIDYDSRIVASNGTTTPGQGTLEIIASNVNISGNNVCHTGNEPSSKTGNGYKKFAEGLIIQWGTISLTANTEGTITFPIAFPNSCLNISTTPNNSGGGSPIVPIGAYSLTPSSCKVMTTSSQGAFWCAIGY